ncbi:MAG TPA: hypothetical protein PKW80_16205 [Bacteroidales bacterium]|nr:hypothetical protein [Bacteroidales bacterium]
MIKKYALISVAAISIIVALFFGYSYIKRLKDPVIPAIKAIPESTVCLIEVRNTLALWERINSKNQIWKELLCLSFASELNSKILLMDSLAKNNYDIVQIFTQNPLYIAWAPDRAEYRCLYTINMNGPHQEKLIDDFMHKHFSSGTVFTTHRFLENEIYEIHKANKILCAYTVYKGIFIIAETSGLVETSLSALLTEISIENNPGFTRLNASSGKKVDANIFIKNNYVDNLISRFLSGKHSAILKQLSLSGDMASLDLTVKNNELLFTGYAITGDPGQMLNKVFRNQTPQQIELTAICPANTAMMTFWGTENTLNYIRNYTDFLASNFHKRSFSDMCSYYDTTYNIDINKDFLQHIGNQYALIITENPNTSNPYRYYGIFRARQIDEFRNALKNISSAPDERSQVNRDSFAIRKLRPLHFLKDFFGGLFTHLDTAYYTTINDYVVIGESPVSLDMYVSAYLSGKTLEKNQNYINFSDNVSDKTNFCLYTNIRRSFRLLTPMFNRKLSDAFNSNEVFLKNFQALAFQLTTDKNKFFLNAYVRHNKEYIEENPSVWEYNADTTISGNISVITDPRDSTKKILFFDVAGNLYMLNRNGQLIWKKNIKEPPLSKVFIANLKKNNKFYLVFNTKNHIYIFEPDGKMPEFSPVKLPYPASTAITLIDYQGKNDYRIIIPCENQIIYNYLVDGKPTPGWNNFRTGAVLKKPVEYFRFKDKDILIATDKNGKVYFINRKGNLVIKSTKDFIKAKNSRFYVHNIQKKQYLLTTDRKGKLVFISENGKIDIVTLRFFSENHFFLTGDFNMDKKDDFIFFDKGKAIVYDHGKKKIFEAETGGDPAASPLYKKINNKFQIVFPSTDCSHLVFLNNKGFFEYKNYILSNPFFELSNLFGKNSNSILAADSSLLLNYIID